MNRQAILMVNLGSPDSPDISDVRRYLSNFLMDKYVVDLPWLLRRCLVTVILFGRSERSSAAYQSVWLPEGSPLVVLSKKLADALEVAANKPVYLAMRYGKPSIDKALYRIKNNQDIDEILLLPMYPHYASSTVETCIKEVQRLCKKYHVTQKITTLPIFYNNPFYIDALVLSAKKWLAEDYDHLLFSYHGLPLSHLRKADPTGCHCLTPYCCEQSSSFVHKTCYKRHILQTTKAFVEKASISDDRYSIAFQSKVGKSKWMEPYTEKQVVALANKGVKKLLVICPSFVVDCLETLEEVDMRLRDTFIKAGGESFTTIPCLNDQSFWVENLTKQINGQLEAEPELAAIPLYL